MPCFLGGGSSKYRFEPRRAHALMLCRKNPGLVWSCADDLGVDIHIANQVAWAFGGRGKGSKK